MIKLIKYIIAWFIIPKGPYCYFRHRGEKCPYYRVWWLENNDHVCYCRYTDTGTHELGNFDFLLYDQCKICGIKENYE